ncbi:MAG TPA: sigma-70 family RNA polymerase sigma factor [Solirubrobacteraceae bacterium]|nr:sigma-70 family RNA polymerase sigma factor [Solirubrobacteraceae bacterium]
MPEPGFTFRYRLCGEDPTVRQLPFDLARVPARGDIVSWDGRVVRPARRGDPVFVGAAVESWDGSEARPRLKVIVDPDAVYAVSDRYGRSVGALVDLSGEPGAQRVAGSKRRGDLEVVAMGSSAPETLVRICDAKHYEKARRRRELDARRSDARRRPRLRLTPEAENRLVIAAAAGDQRASSELVETYLPAIGGVARLYRQASVERADLVQEGVVGLLRAARRFDPGVGRPFWAYAGWWVRQAMQQLVSELTRPTALSDRAMRALARVKRARHELMQRHGRDPTLAELAETTRLSFDQIEDLLAVDSIPRRLEEPIDGEAGGGTCGDLVIDEQAESEFDHVIDRIEIDRVRVLVDHLAEREREILHDRYGLGRPARTLQEIGNDLGVSAERVRQIEAGALTKLSEAAAGQLSP